MPRLHCSLGPADAAIVPHRLGSALLKSTWCEALPLIIAPTVPKNDNFNGISDILIICRSGELSQRPKQWRKVDRAKGTLSLSMSAVLRQVPVCPVLGSAL